MQELIERLQSANGPDRGLDSEIMRVTFGAEVWSYDDNDHIDHMIERGMWTKPREEHPDFDPKPAVTWRYRCGGLANPDAEYGEIPSFTASIDAALKLLPKDFWWEVRQLCAPNSPMRNFGSRNGMFMAAAHKSYGESGIASSHDVPAIALCLSILRARDALMGRV
jgi:hypothetical protein